MRTDLARLRPVAIVLAACAAACVLAGCRPAAPAVAYFPLEKGTVWTYRIVTDATEEIDAEDPIAMTVTNEGREDLGGVAVTRQTVDRDAATYLVFMAVDENGVFRHATQAPGEKAPAVEPVRTYLVRDPLRVGSSWPGRSAPAYIDIMDFRGPVDVVSTIAQVGAGIRTPAGDFRDTVRIEVRGSAQIGEPAGAETNQAKDDDWDLYRGTYSVAETIWLARGVGMVKSVVVERFVGDFEQRSVTVTTELQSFAR